jgi:hypothetical protein
VGSLHGIRLDAFGPCFAAVDAGKRLEKAARSLECAHGLKTRLDCSS